MIKKLDWLGFIRIKIVLIILITVWAKKNVPKIHFRITKVKRKF